MERPQESDATAQPHQDDLCFYAHSSARPDKSDWQTLADHLTAVGDLAAVFAADFGAQTPAQAAGLLHDLGKYTLEFQKRLEGGAKVDHATWGARTAAERFGSIGLKPPLRGVSDRMARRAPRGRVD